MIDRILAYIDALMHWADQPFQAVYDFFTDPFLPVLFGVILVILGMGAVKWFFPNREWPGWIAGAAAFFAWAFRKGQNAEKDRRRVK